MRGIIGVDRKPEESREDPTRPQLRVENDKKREDTNRIPSYITLPWVV